MALLGKVSKHSIKKKEKNLFFIVESRAATFLCNFELHFQSWFMDNFDSIKYFTIGLIFDKNFFMLDHFS